MKNLGGFSDETPFNIMGSQNTEDIGFGIENQGKNENIKISDFSINNLGQYILFDWFQFTVFYDEYLTSKDDINNELISNPLTFNRKICNKLFKDLFNIEEQDIIYENRGRNGYTDCYSYKTIEMYTCSYKPFEMGVNVIMKGQGCREFEKLDLSWSILINKLFNKYRFNVNRVDVAIDDYTNNYYTIPKLKKYVKNGLVRSRFKADYEIKRVNLDDGSTIGEQIQFGSRASQLEITFYNKLLERHYNQFIVDNNIKQWTRCELRFRDKRAYQLLEKVNSGLELNMLVKGVLSNYLNFLVKSPTDSNKARWSVVTWWSEFLEGFDKISLATRNPENSITKKKEWLYDFVSKTDLTVFASELENFDLDNQSSSYLKEFLIKGFRTITDKDLEKINSHRLSKNLVPITKEQLHDYLYSIKDIILVNNDILYKEYQNNEKYFGSDNRKKE